MQTRIMLTNVRDGTPDDLESFFKDFGEVEVEKIALAIKGELDIVQVLITIAGTWVAERYILDPLADKLAAWQKAAVSLKDKQFKIVVHFRNGKLTSFETIRISSPFIVGRLWQIIKSISDLLAAKDVDMSFDQVLIVPNGTNDPLIIAHQGNRPTQVINLAEKTISPIREISGESPELAFWEIEQLALRLEYLLRLPGDYSSTIKGLIDDIRQKVIRWL